MAKKIKSILTILIAVGFLLATFVSVANSQEEKTLIDKDTILNQNIAGSVEIIADNITLDCSGHSIIGNPDDVSGIYIYNRKNVIIKNCTIIQFLIGVDSRSSSSISIINNSITNSDSYAIYDYYSDNNIIDNNNISSNNWVGISLRNSSKNKITNNNISNNGANGVHLTNSSSNEINNNEILSNNNGGIELSHASSNIISNNEIENNYRGIIIGRSSENIVTENDINSNSKDGIYLYETHFNTIFLNNFENNTNNIFLYSSDRNNWNSPEIINYNYNGSTFTSYLGNHWGGYSGKDVDNNGIGDTSYPYSGIDSYPLMAFFENYISPPEAEKWSFAIITDLHIGRGYSDYDGTGYNDSGEGEDYYLTERLKKAVNWINENKNNVNCGDNQCSIKFLAVLGDIADTAEKSEFLKAKNILYKLNDPNQDGDISDGIPYIPVFGNHDVWPYTDYEEATTPLGENYFDEIFWDENSTNSQLINQFFGDSWKRDEANQKYKNFAFSYSGINFIGLDFNSRESTGEGVKSEAIIFPETENWLRNHLDEYQRKEPVILFFHHLLAKPLSREAYVLPWSNFSTEEIERIEGIVEGYENIIEGSQILGAFGGHIHGFEKLGKEKISFSPFDLFIPANWEYPSMINTSVLSTESLMVGGNEKNINNKGVIRIVKINDENNIDFSTIDGKFPALNPYVSFDFKILGEQVLPCLFFKAHLFTHRNYSLIWDFGDGNTGTNIIETHCYSGSGNYNVKLTAIDEETGEEEYITRKINVEEGIVPRIIKIRDEIKDKLELISVELREKVTELGRTMIDSVLVQVKHSPSTPVGIFTVHFEQALDDIDLTELIADFDSNQRKSVLYMPEWPVVIEEEKILFIPSTGAGSVYICPEADSLEDVNEECENKIILNIGETKNGITLSLINYEGQEYYLVYGITGTGGGELGNGNLNADLSTQIAITEMIYGESDILSGIISGVGDGQPPLLLSELKESAIDLEDYTLEGKLNSEEKKKLKMKFKFLETAGNEYQGKSINMKFNFKATQEEQ